MGNKVNVLYPELSYKIIGLAMRVHNKLGCGFLEKVYENALVILLRREGLRVEQQASIKVYFEGEIVGEFVADILVEGKIILELKAVEKLTSVHRAQAINYLKATGIQLALLLNFGGKSLEHERILNETSSNTNESSSRKIDISWMTKGK
jgi:GxxExxY protein